MNVEEKSNIDLTLNKLVKDLTKYCNHFETITVQISSQLPVIEGMIDSSITSFNSLKTILQNENNSTNELVKFNTNLTDVIENLKETQNNNTKIFSILGSSIETLNNTVQNIKSIDSLSEELKVFAVNSIIYAQHSGESGKGYQYISLEFIKLSEEISRITKDISTLGQELNIDIEDVKHLIDEQISYNDNTISELNNETKELIEISNVSIEKLLSSLDSCIKKISTIKAPINEIMIQIQVQDIIQQQLEHIIETILNINNTYDKNFSKIFTTKKSDESSDYLAFLNFLLVVSEKEISRINKDILNLLERVEAPLNQIMSVINFVNSQSSFLNDKIDTGETNKLIHMIFVSPQITIDKIQKKIDNNFNKQNDIELKLEKVEKDTIKQNKMALSLEPLIERIKNLMFLAKVEKERSKLQIDLDLAQKQNIFNETTITIIKSINDSSLDYSLKLKDMKSIFKEEVKEYKNISSDLNRSLEFLKKTEDLFRNEFDSNIEILLNLTKDINHYFNLFANLKDINDNMKSKLSLLNEFKSDIREKCISEGGFKKLNSTPFLKSMVDEVLSNLTVNEERETIMEEFPELEIEKSEGSSVTLF